MEGQSSWDSYPVSNTGAELLDLEPISEDCNGDDANGMSFESILPDDILERILSFLPIASIFRATAVCKRWYRIAHSSRFMWASNLPQKPWYFMFTSNEDPEGHAYDPVLQKWYKLHLPCIEKSNWFIASSRGLVCFMDNDSRSRVFVCNPIKRDWKRLLEPPGAKFPDYSTLAMSLNPKSQCYTVALTKSKQVPDDFLLWEFSIHIYESDIGSWATPVKEVLAGWRGGDESVICDGVLYCLVHSTGVLVNADPRHALIMYDLSSRFSHVSLMHSLVPVPCSLTCGRLMNLKDRPVMVGGIAKHDRPDIIKGICIWELRKKEWREVARMPQRFFQGFGEFDDVFASSGAEDLIYIQSYGSTALLVFDMNRKQWKWPPRCRERKKFPLQLFTGFCFQPRLSIAS